MAKDERIDFVTVCNLLSWLEKNDINEYERACRLIYEIYKQSQTLKMVMKDAKA